MLRQLSTCTAKGRRTLRRVSNVHATGHHVLKGIHGATTRARETHATRRPYLTGPLCGLASSLQPGLFRCIPLQPRTMSCRCCLSYHPDLLQCAVVELRPAGIASNWAVKAGHRKSKSSSPDQLGMANSITAVGRLDEQIGSIPCGCLHRCLTMPTSTHRPTCLGPGAPGTSSQQCTSAQSKQ